MNAERDRAALLAAIGGLRPHGSAVAIDPGSALAGLVATFQLTGFERDVLLLGAAAEIDPEVLGVAAELPTVGLALDRLPFGAWEAFAPDRPLRARGLIELLPATGLSRAQYRLPERVLHALLGIATIDPEVAVRAVALEPGGTMLSGTHEGLLEQLAACWRIDVPEGAPGWPVLVLAGADHAAKRTIAARLADGFGLQAWLMDASLLPDGAAERDALARIWQREAALGSVVLVLAIEEELEPARRRAALSWLERMDAAAIVLLRDRAQVPGRVVRAVDVERPDGREQRAMWGRVLGGQAAARAGEIERVVGQFSLDAASIGRLGGEAVAGEPLWDQVRADARPSLEALAQRLPTGAGWADLVLPPTQQHALKAIVAQVRHRATVQERWGFSRDGRGLGVTALFAGPSGVGKTLAAEVLAAELGLDIYRVDLSRVVSKYIGETEQNLRRVFDAADGGGAVLLFDEADAIFGKRTEVHDSHDRYANIEVSYLLQRMETYRGLAILTTNFRSALDTAFLRRLRFIVNFPFPATEERVLLWQSALPPLLPRAELRLERLAQLRVTGGTIRNIALGAGFLAAEEGGAVTMAHMLRAARTEYAKLDQPLTEAELAGWP